MSNNNKRSNNRGNNRNNKRFNSDKRGPKANLPTCTICGKTIRNLNTAIANKNDGTPAHFDCIVERLSTTETLGNHEKICYLGSGSFGIVRQKPGSGVKNFFIRKRIQYENQDVDLEWRKKISNRYLKKV